MPQIFKPDEILDMQFTFTKDDARSVLECTGYKDFALMDRFNLEAVLPRFMNGKVTVLPESVDRDLGIKVGYGFNYCIAEPIIEKNVTENVLEIPIMKELLARGCEINFIGKSAAKFQQFDDKMKDFSAEWKKLPKPYKPIADWIEDCVENYEEKYEMEFPEVDLVILNAFPSFFYQNMMFYLINLHYAKKGVPVFLWDIELRTLRIKDYDTMPKVFKYSGADKVFSKEDFDLIASNAYWLVQIPGEAMGKMRQLNPTIQMLSFFPPYWIREDLGMYNMMKHPKFRTAYVGNDSERRKTIKKFFTPLSKKNKLHLFGGGMSQRSEGYEGFDALKGTIKMHGAIAQEEVWRTYNNSRTCLSVARQRYYEAGHIVHRWLEVVLAGCILLVPRDLHGVENYLNKSFIVDDCEHFEDKINLFNDRANMDKLLHGHWMQKKFIYKTFSAERGVDTILRTAGV